MHVQNFSSFKMYSINFIIDIYTFDEGLFSEAYYFFISIW